MARVSLRVYRCLLLLHQPYFRPLVTTVQLIRKVHATYANLIATQEVTGGIVLGIFLLHELPSFTAVIGVAVTLVDIAGVLV